MPIKEYSTFTWSEIIEMKKNKSELAKHIGITCSYDTALPQEWLNKFVEFYEFNYHHVIYSTFMVYDAGNYFGQPYSACDEIQQAINKERIEWIADTLADDCAQSIVDDLKRLTGVDIGTKQDDLSNTLIRTLERMKLKDM